MRTTLPLTSGGCFQNSLEKVVFLDLIRRGAADEQAVFANEE